MESTSTRGCPGTCDGLGLALFSAVSLLKLVRERLTWCGRKPMRGSRVDHPQRLIDCVREHVWMSVLWLFRILSLMHHQLVKQ